MYKDFKLLMWLHSFLLCSALNDIHFRLQSSLLLCAHLLFAVISPIQFAQLPLCNKDGTRWWDTILLGKWDTSMKSYNIIIALKEVKERILRSTRTMSPIAWRKEFCKIQKCQEKTTVWVHLNKIMDDSHWIWFLRALCVLTNLSTTNLAVHFIPVLSLTAKMHFLREISLLGTYQW